MKVIVITGSTRGIGYGLADSFLALDCAVTVSGRTQEAVDKAVAELSARHGEDRVFGHPCDVTDFEQVQALWNAAKTQFDKIDIWINNAGLGNPQMDFWELPAEEIQAVVSTNLIGAMYGTKVALRGMLEQGFGGLYNMEGPGQRWSQSGRPGALRQHQSWPAVSRRVFSTGDKGDTCAGRCTQTGHGHNGFCDTSI